MSPLPIVPQPPSFSWGSQLPTLVARRIRLRWLETSDIPALFAIVTNALAVSAAFASAVAATLFVGEAS